MCRNPGDYLTMDVVGERALIVRGKDGVVRGFHNLCRHRGSRVVADNHGNCKNALVCPFHGWVYNLDGTLRGAARPRSFPELDKNEFGLMKLDLEIWMGFIFIRFRSGPQPSVAELMKPVEAEIAHYHVEDMVPSWGIWTQKSPVNWKSVRDVDNEGYHVAMAHPALQDLYGATYFDEPFVGGVSRSFATYNPHAGRPLERAQLHQRRARADASARALCARPGSTTASSQQRAVDHAGIGAVLSGVPAVDRRDAAARRHLPLQGREPRAGRRALPRLPHRPRHHGRGRAAFGLVERVDAVAVALPASICPTSNMACAPTTTTCASWCRCSGSKTRPRRRTCGTSTRRCSGGAERRSQPPRTVLELLATFFFGAT